MTDLRQKLVEELTNKNFSVHIGESKFIFVNLNLEFATSIIDHILENYEVKEKNDSSR